MFNVGVSIILPVYNISEKIFKRTMLSIFKQSFQNWELIVVDDGSSDVFCKFYDSYSCKKVKIIHKSNGGVSSARNFGLKHCNKDYVCFIDGDDVIHENFLKTLVGLSVSLKSDITICCCSYLTQNLPTCFSLGKNGIVELNTKTAIDDLCYMNQYFKGNEFTSVWGKLYKRDIVEGVKFDYRMSIGEDFVFNYFCFKKSKKIIISEQPLYGYYTDSDGLMKGRYIHKKIMTLCGLDDLKKMVDFSDVDSVTSRIINIELVLLLMIPVGEFISDRLQIINRINIDRKKVLFNLKCRTKVRLALILSYLGYDNMQKIFELFKKYSKPK